MSIKHEWQKKWRETLGKPTDSMPDIRDHYALHFDIWNVGDVKLQECFTIFPNGDASPGKDCLRQFLSGYGNGCPSDTRHGSANLTDYIPEQRHPTTLACLHRHDKSLPGGRLVR